VPNDVTVSYNWSYSGTGVTISGTTNSVSVDYDITATSGTLGVTATNGCGTSIAREIAITVNTVPTATLISSDANDTICSGTAVVFTAGGGTGYNFYLNTVSVQNGASNTYTNLTLNDGDAVYVAVTNLNGCSSISTTIITTVHALPIITLTGNIISCGGSTETYTTESGMSNYSWNVSAGGTITAGGGSSDNSATVDWLDLTPPPNPSPQTISVNYTDSNGCSAEADEVLNVNVFKTPVTGPEYHIENNWNP